MSDVEICRWVDLPADLNRDQLIGDLDSVFFTSSATQSFADETSKAAFRTRWFGRYLDRFADCAFIALDTDRRAIGYVVGSFEDPARDPFFADIPSVAPFAALSARYPAHLHVNLDAAWRGRGIGARLVDAFAAMAREAGAAGVHVVTGRGMRNVGFYLAHGFAERGSAAINGRDLLFLGRDL